MLLIATELLLRQRNFRGREALLNRLLSLNDGAFVRSRYGVKLRVVAGDYTNQASLGASNFSSDYDDVFAEVAALRLGDAFIDIGSNQGLFSIVAAKSVGPDGAVLAFEPNLSVFKELVCNAVENELGNLYPVNAAIGRTSQLAKFRPGPSTHSGIGQLATDGNSTVLTICFDDCMPLFQRVIGSRSTTIKIDVEGHEAHVIAAMTNYLQQRNVMKLIIEIDEDNLRKHGSCSFEIYDSLEKIGFTCRRGKGAAPHYNEIFHRAEIT